MDPQNVAEVDSATSESSNTSQTGLPGDESDLTDEDFREEIQKCLDEMKHQGTFSSMNTTSLYINPGLRIKNGGAVGLPLTIRDAQELAAVCKQSPFGKGDETLVDESVRKTWELDTTEFSCCNPAWKEYIDKLAKQAMQGLGVEAPGHAVAYKLLLYEEGAFFKAHRDTEKVPGMFGTLVICLPSEHTGGEVRLSHGDTEKIIKTAPTSAFDLTALAWYSDVQHEIKAIKSGYRLVLTYNLVQDQSFPRQTASALDSTASKLERLLRIWQTRFSYQKSFIYPLSHRYTQASLSLRHLKGKDAAKCRYLEQLCKKNDVYWFLSHMTKETSDDYYEYESDDETKLGPTFTPMGMVINLDLENNPEDTQILADVEKLYGRTADSEDEGEYTGNENMPSTCRYHDTVAVMMRKDVAIARFGEENHTNASLMALFELVSNDEHCSLEHQRAAMQVLLRKSMKMITHEGRSDRSNYQMYEFLGHGQDRENKRAEYAQSFDVVSEFCYAKGLDDAVAAVLRDAMQDRLWHESKELVGLIAKCVAKETAQGKKDVWDNWLAVPMPSVVTYKFVNERYKILDAVQKIIQESSVATFDGWKRAHLETYLEAVRSFSQQDVLPVLELLPYVGNRVYFDTFIPNMTANPDAAGLARFLQLLSQRAGQDAALGDVEVKTYQQLVPALKEVYQLHPHNLASESYFYPGSYHRQPPTPTSAVDEFIDLIQRCRLVLHLPTEAQTLFVRGLPDLPGSDPTFWSNWRALLVFIKTILKLLLPTPDNTMREIASEFITKSIQGLATHRASSRPIEPKNWSRPRAQRNEKCSCAPCAALKTFLHDPNLRTGRFSHAKKTRQHLEYSLDRDDFRFETESSRSPHTLIITKTNNAYDRDLREWEEDVRQFKQGVVELRSEMMSELLGGDILAISGIDKALERSGARGAGGAQPLQHATASRRNVGRPAMVAGTKRKSDVIDLTEDDSPPPHGSKWPRGPFVA